MATKKNETVEIVEKTEATATEVAETKEVNVTLFGKIGTKLDAGLTKVGNGIKRNGKKIAKGAGVAAGAAAAVVGTAVVLDVVDRAKALEAATEPEEGIIDVEPSIEPEDEAPFEADAA